MKSKTEFLIGCNYWASNAGCFMWKRFDENVVKKDLEYLASYGVNCIRVFPTWDDFQPIMENPIPHSPYFDKFSFRMRVNDRVMLEQAFPESGLSEEKLEQFKKMLDIAKECNMKVIVSFITGWMSGRRFIPEALRGKDVIADPTAIMWECRFIKDMITQIKHYDNIIAWEPGNECSCLSHDVTPEQSELWLMVISNAIRLADSTRPVYSGMYSTRLQGEFNARMTGRYFDMATTHPYPCFMPYCSTEDVRQMRAALHSACENSYYSSIAGKPCMVEEINTLGPCVVADDYVPEFFEKSLMTSIATGTTGYLWWCGFEQDKLDFPPYDSNQLERNLGLAYPDYTEKPVLRAMKEMSEVTNELGVLPIPKADAVTILTFLHDHWKIAYASFMLGVQAGRHIDFMYEEDEVKDSDYYILPCITGINSMPYLQTKKIIDRVERGAKLLITFDGGGIGDFEYLTGMKVAGRNQVEVDKTFTIDGVTMTIPCSVKLQLVPTTAKVIIRDSNGDVLLAENTVGKGKVTFFNASLESFYTTSYLPENTAMYKVYKHFFKDKEQIFAVDSPKVMVTHHELGSGRLAVMVNNFEKENKINFTLQDCYKIVENRYAEVKGNTLYFKRSFAYLELEHK